MSTERTREVRHWRTRSIIEGSVWISTQHLIAVSRPPQLVFAIADDLKRWPEIFPPCQAVEILERAGSVTRFRITACANEDLVSWVSQRTADQAAGRVDFAQLEPFAPLAAMKGTWWFKPVFSGTLIRFVHHFSLDPARFTGLDDPAMAEAELAICRAVDANSTAELCAIRGVCEAD